MKRPSVRRGSLRSSSGTNDRHSLPRNDGAGDRSDEKRAIRCSPPLSGTKRRRRTAWVSSMDCNGKGLSITVLRYYKCQVICSVFCQRFLACFEICTPEGRVGEKGGNANFKTKHTEPLTLEMLCPLQSISPPVWPRGVKFWCS